jgi:tRNA(Ile)-lysidine synthase
MLIRKVQRYIQEHSLLASGDRVLVAYSGGADSTCLLLILRELFPDTAAAYVNHNLRGKESKQEEEFVRRFCSGHSIPLFVEHLSWNRGRSNLEEEARKKRYRHLAKVATAEGYQKVALAHHRDDLLETFFLRLLRGSGPSGLAGMKPSRGIYIRPLLECTREEIEEYIRARNAQYFTDSSNQNLDFARNRIRHELIPYLQQHFNPAIRSALARSARWLDEQHQLIAEYLESQSGVIRNEKQELSFSRDRFLELSNPLKKALLKKILVQVDPSIRPSARLLKALLESIEKKENLELPGFLMIESFGDSVRFRSKIGSIGYCEIDVPGAGIYPFPPGNVALDFSISETIELPSPKDVAFLDAEKASFPLSIRNWKKGDHFYPFGMSGRKKLSDFWIDEKIPRKERKRIPLVFKNDDLIWIGGHRIDERYRIIGSTKKVLKIELQREHV